MKKLLIILMACNMYPAFAQEEEITDTTRYPPVGSKEYYLNKSRNQTKGGRTFLIVGTAMIVAGIIEGSSGSANNENFGYGSSFEAGASLLVVGILVDLASIPFFTSASKNARMAAAAGETSGEYKKDLKKISRADRKQRKSPGTDNLTPFPDPGISFRESSLQSMISGY